MHAAIGGSSSLITIHKPKREGFLPILRMRKTMDLRSNAHTDEHTHFQGYTAASKNGEKTKGKENMYAKRLNCILLKK